MNAFFSKLVMENGRKYINGFGDRIYTAHRCLLNRIDLVEIWNIGFYIYINAFFSKLVMGERSSRFESTAHPFLLNRRDLVEIWNIGFSPTEYFTWTHFSQKLVMGERSKIHQSVRFLIPHIYITSVSLNRRHLQKFETSVFLQRSISHERIFLKTSDGRTVENTSICSVSDTAYIYITSVSVESKTLRRNLKHRFFSNGVFHMNAFFSKN